METRHKKFKFWKEMNGECLVVPIDSFKCDVCFIVDDPTGMIIDNASIKAGGIQNVPQYLIERVLDQLFEMPDAMLTGSTIIEVKADAILNTHVHIHTAVEFPDPITDEHWDDLIAGDRVDVFLNDCGIKRPKS